eukprot:2887317-Alexandrium_andersonii.AAC.1
MNAIAATPTVVLPLVLYAVRPEVASWHEGHKRRGTPHVSGGTDFAPNERTLATAPSVAHARRLALDIWSVWPLCT